MRHPLGGVDRPRVVPIRATRAFPREDRAAVSNIVDLRTAWSSCACSTQCLVGWTGDCGHSIPFASSQVLHLVPLHTWIWCSAGALLRLEERKDLVQTHFSGLLN